MIKIGSKKMTVVGTVDGSGNLVLGYFDDTVYREILNMNPEALEKCEDD